MTTQKAEDPRGGGGGGGRELLALAAKWREISSARDLAVYRVEHPEYCFAERLRR
jgi:hypothetical protein